MHVKVFSLLILLRTTSYLVAHGQYPEVVITDPSDGIIKEGQWFTLKCRYRNTYIKASWYKNNNYDVKSSEFNKRADRKTGGSYQCQRDNFWSRTSRSKPLEVVTIASDVMLTVQVHSSTLLLGEMSVLKCSRHPWGFERDYTSLWYRNNSLIEGEHEPEYTIASAKFSDGATYRCEQRLGFRRWISHDESIIVRDLCSEPTLQADPSVELFVGERFKLACLAEPFHDDHSLLYVFYKNGESLNFPSEKSSYTTEEATLDHSGTYQCEVKTRDSKLRKKSNIVPISIKRIPVSVPDLSIHPGNEVVEGDSTSLNCSVTRGSTPIQYIFYRDGKEIYWEYSNHSRTIHTFINASKRQEGYYHCAVSNQEGESLQYSKAIAVSVIAQAHSAEMAALIVPLFLILSLLALLPIKLRNRKQADSSSRSQQQREVMGNRAEDVTEDRRTRNFDYAEIGPSRLNMTSCAGTVYSSVTNTGMHDVDTKTDGGLVYSVITIPKPRNTAHCDVASGGKHADQADQQPSCITYATLRHTDMRGDEEPGQGEEGNVYANLPRTL
ncbi:Fc receptor-like protein 6 isoform X6 [Stegostoma tigrinum]|uniref:Fc receptor-like protein 6 isoform X6 n=1 Tax=Stegostoma tigrinum TaxID=3053191 RepID=UPI0028706FE6|nr:Fc receptor-like protein 6 isoform X6 [Stegostoma tigrinum]